MSEKQRKFPYVARFLCLTLCGCLLGCASYRYNMGVPRPVRPQPDPSLYTDLRIGQEYTLRKGAIATEGILVPEEDAASFRRTQKVPKGTIVKVNRLILMDNVTNIALEVMCESGVGDLTITSWMMDGSFYKKDITLDPVWWEPTR